MAEEIVIKIGLDGRDASQAADQLGRKIRSALDGSGLNQSSNKASQQFGKIKESAIDARRGVESFSQVIGQLQVAAASFIGIGLGAALQQIGRAAVDSAIQVDRSRQALAALLGSADAANKKLAELRKLAAETPGVTAQNATSIYAQLRAIKGVTDQTINSLVQSLGKLSASSEKFGDPADFARNLTQIFTQSFERGDIKEALGRVPIFEDFLESAFGTKDPARLKALQQAGKLTLDGFLGGIARAVASNPTLKDIQESLGGKFQKTFADIQIALVPLGEELANRLLPTLQKIEGVVKSVTETVTGKLKENKEAIDRLLAASENLSRAVGGLAGAVGDLVSSFSALADNQIVSFFSPGPQRDIAFFTKAIDFARNAVTLLGTAFELFKTAALGAIKGVTLGLEQGLNFVLQKIGINIDFLTKDISRLRGDIDGLARRAGNAVNPQIAPPSSPFTAPEVPPNAQELILGPAKGGGKPTATLSGSAESKARSLREARLAFVRESLDQELALVKAKGEQELSIAQDLYERGIRSTSDYYDIKISVARQFTLAEIDLLNREAAQISETLAAAKPGTTEKIKLETELLRVRGEIIRKTIEQTSVERENLRAFKKELGDLPAFKPSESDFERLKGETTSTGLPANVPRVVGLSREASAVAIDAARDAEIKTAQLGAEQARVQNQINTGILTEAEGRQQILAIQRQQRDVQIRALELERVTADSLRKVQIDEQIESIRLLGVELDNTQRFMKGFGSATETVGDAFERLGQNVGQALSSTTNLLGNLGNAVKRFFADLVGSALQNAGRSVLGAIFGQGQVGGGSSAGGGASILGGIGGILGGSAGGVSPRTPNFNPNAFAGGGAATAAVGGFGGLTGGFLQLGSLLGGGISVPGSTSAGSVSSGSQAILDRLRKDGIISGGLSGLFSNLTKGIGFGLPKGGAIRGGLASALPLFGVGLGSSLGGGGFGSILGGIGGGLLGIGATAAPGFLGTGLLAGLFSNPITAAIGAALLPTAFLVGRARQRRADEKTSGDSLQRAIDAIGALRDQVRSDAVDGKDAFSIFNNDILQAFKVEVSQLKTKSVRESRLTNQVRDLQNLYEQAVVPAVLDQARRKGIFARQIPEFATGGIVPGRDLGFDNVMALLRPREMVLTVQQQQTVQSIAGADVFGRAGVPNAGRNVGGSQAFATGGVVQPAQTRVDNSPIIIEKLIINQDAEGIFIAGGNTAGGRQVIVQQIEKAGRKRETS
ncbi:MAG TPA: hypothetical protein VJ302_30735 [Blastocatellia bacterium]|nr:hypothetical protein [Blastocatellia bacterium]